MPALTAKPLTAVRGARPLTALNLGEALATWTPADLFASSEEGAFFDFSSASYLRQNSDGTGAVTAVGDPVGWAEDLSGNGNNATQSTDTARPVWARVPAGGRRNLAPQTIDLSSAFPTLANGAVWSGTDVVVFPASLSPAPQVTSDTIALPAGQVTFSIEAQAVSGSGSARLFSFNSTDGGASSATFAIDDTGWTKLTQTRTITEESLLLYLRKGAADGAIDIRWRNFQIEAGATATAYQTVTAAYDITESGVASVFYPLDDEVDDALTVAMPDLGTDATRAVVNLDGTVTYLENQTIGAGNVDIPLNKAAVIYIDRDLTAGKKTDLEAWA